MPAKKHKQSEPTFNYVNSANKIERWQLCQKIGVLYYESEISHNKLESIFLYLQRSGVLTDENFNF